MDVAITGIAILVISTVGAWLWSRKGAADGQEQAKVLLFGLYFWILFFMQLIVVAIGYSLLAD
jgi:hypothetical protein